MKGKDYAISKFKHQLLAKKYRGEPSVVWSLRPEQVEYVENVLGFKVIPYIFRISPKTFPRAEVREKGSILKEVHYAGRDKKSRIFRKLSFKEQQLLKEYGVYFTPFKYKIILN